MGGRKISYFFCFVLKQKKGRGAITAARPQIIREL